jgi:histidyl-tRNA synthetase
LKKENSIPYCIIIGDGEIKDNVVKLRNVVNRSEETLARETLVEELKKRLNLNENFEKLKI